MKKRLFRLGALCCVAAMTITTGAQALSVEEAYDILQRSYVDKLPRAAQDAKSLDELFSYTDDYTYYMTAEEYQAFLQGVEGDVSFAGIGAEITYVPEGIRIVSVLKGGGAEKAGLAAGDIIIAIESESCAPGGAEHRAKLLGEAGTSVTVTVRHADGTQADYTVTRALVTQTNTTVSVTGGVGYIDCDSFGTQTGTYFQEGVRGNDSAVHAWIVDLRGNGGGLTSAAVSALGAFSGEGDLTYFVDQDGESTAQSYSGKDLTDKPAIVLMDSGSASASEIFAGGVLGTGSYDDIVSVADRLLNGGETVSEFGDIDAPADEAGRVLTTPQHYAYIKIAEGCNNFCAFCIIPHLRGRYRSRAVEDILQEARGLAESGVKELIVVAQDTSRYGTDLYGAPRLPLLLHELCRIEGFHWIRVHYLYPDMITDELLDTFASEPKLVNYMDIPIQHVNDAILRRMNRRGTRAELDEMLQKLRSRLPDAVIRTSLITGLPGEGEAEFEELCAWLRENKGIVQPWEYAATGNPEPAAPDAKLVRSHEDLVVRPKLRPLEVRMGFQPFLSVRRVRVYDGTNLQPPIQRLEVW